jgi:hypothetical protein
MIVTLADLKNALGLDSALPDADEDLTRLLEAKTAWVEGATQRRFDTPIPHVQYQDGGVDTIYLEWHVDADEPIVVSRRPLLERFRDWEVLVEGEDWERRDQSLLFLRPWQIWPSRDEFKVEYNGGYDVPPADIAELIRGLVIDQYFANIELVSDISGITSEKIGDYSYNVGSAGGSASGGGSVNDDARQVLNRYKRRFV